MILNYWTKCSGQDSPASELTWSFLSNTKCVFGEGLGRFYRTLWFRLCVLFWPKAKKILATAAINIMNFLYLTTRTLPKRKIKQNYRGLLFSPTSFQGVYKDKERRRGSQFKADCGACGW